jgi:hypothetical protein
VKTSDDRAVLDASARHIAITEAGDAWVGFGQRGFVAKFNRACDEVGRAFVAGRIVAMDALRDGSIAVLCSGRHDPWGRRTADSTVVVLSPDGEERSRRVLSAQPSTALVAESGARFHVDGQWSVVTLTSSGGVRSRPMGGAPRSLCRDPRTREPWLSLPYRIVALDEAPARSPSGQTSLTTVIPGFTQLAAKRVDGGAWVIYRAYNRGQPYALARVAPTTAAGPFPPATIVAEVLLSSQPTHLAATSDGGAWMLLPGALARRVDVIGTTVETVEWSERSSENRAFASSDSGEHCAALMATREGCVLRRATVE